MTTKDTALRLALEALESATNVVEGEYGCDDPLAAECSEALTACREALEQPADGVCKCDICGSALGLKVLPCETCKPAQPAGESMAYDKTELNCFAQDLYDQKMQEGKHGHYETMFHVIHQCIKRVIEAHHQSAQPSEWVGLSDEEANALWESTDSDWELMKRTEKFLREKNAGKPAANQCKPMGLEESVTDVRVCCGEYAKCHRACTPRGRWQATQEAAADKAGGDEPVAYRHLHEGEWEYYDAPTGEDCSGCQALFTRPQPQADAPETNFGDMKGAEP